MADKSTSKSSSNKKEIERAEIDDLVQVLHTMYEFANMPSMMIRKRHSNGERIPKLPRGTIRTKSTSLSNKYKNEADSFFLEGDFEQATFAYTQCLKYAEPDSENIGHAYANRSAALFKLGNYRECQFDVVRALNSNYPEGKKRNLHERYEHCLPFLIKSNPAESDEDHTSSNQMEGDDQKKPVKFIRSEKGEIDLVWRKLRKDFDKDSPLRGTSNKIRLECNETWGRHMIASENIKTGEILSCEKYFALTVHLDINEKRNPGRCSFCLSHFRALVPCDSCSMEVYCSTYCSIRAYDLYHRIECRTFRYNHQLGNVMDQYDAMALRMLLIGTDQGTGLKTLMKKLPMRHIFAEKIDPTPDKPFVSDYLATLRLRRTFPKPLLDFNSKPGVVVRMIIALKNVGYFDNYPKEQKNALRQKRLSNEELFAALLLVNHIVSLKPSVIPMMQLGDKFGAIYNNKTIGMGVVILHNMINHSCNPNAFRFTRYHENVLVALRPISKGDQIFITYCGYYARAPFLSRQQALASPLINYRFTCQCEACINSWSLDKDLIERGDSFLDAKEDKSDSLKKKLQELNKMTLAFRKNDGVNNMSRYEILDLISRVCDWLYANLDQPSAVINTATFVNLGCVMYVYDSSRRGNATDASMVEGVNKVLPKIVSLVHEIPLPSAPLNGGKTSKKKAKQANDRIEPRIQSSYCCSKMLS